MTGSRRVQRGLLALEERHTPFRVTSTVEERVNRRLERLQKAPLGDYAWKEAWSEFKHLAGSRPNLHGRRLMGDTSVAKAQYLARVSYRAWKGRSLPTGRSWGHLRSALTVVYSELS